MNFSLFNIILNNRLSNDLVGRYLYSFSSGLSLVFNWFNNRFHLNSFILLSLELNINVFSLDNWLNISLVVNFFTRSCYSLSSGSFLENWLSHNRFFSFILRFSFLEFNSFNVVNDLSLNNRLSIDFFGGSSNSFVDGFFSILNRSSLNWIVVNLSFSSVNLKLNIFSQNSRLNILFSNSSSSWNINRNSFSFDFTINNWFFVFSFGVNRSRNDLFSDNRCLNNSLFNDWLLNNSLSNNRLRNNFSSNNRFRYNLLSLSNNRFRVKNFSTNNLSISSVLS